jgi:hypothetical protein
MSFRTWLLAAAAGGLLGSMQYVVAQESAQPVEIAKFPEMQESAQPGSVRPAPRGSAGRTSDDAAAGPASDLVENGWDFNKPDTIPGFGSLPANSAAQK